MWSSSSRALLLARTSLLVSAPALCLVRPPPVWRGGPAFALPASRLSITMTASGGLSKRAARRRRFEGRTGGGGGTTQPAVDSSTTAAAQDTTATPAARINELTRRNQPQEVLRLFNATEADDERREMLPLVVRALLKCRAIESAIALQRRHAAADSLPLDTKSACTLFLALCRTGRLEDASTMLADLEAAHPPPSEEEAQAQLAAAGSAAGGGGSMVAGGGGGAAAARKAAAAAQAAAEDTAEEEPMWHAIGSTMLPGLALALLDAEQANQTERAAALVEKLQMHPPSAQPPEYMLTRLVRQFGKQRCFQGVYACLDVHGMGGRLADDPEWLQAMADALVRNVRFVKGGVSMATLPPLRGMPEVAFVGRSNVGKSSLTNFFLNRKAIAYTSKTPGKTQQYNYFVVNDPADAGGPSKRRKSRPQGLGGAPARDPDADKEAWRTHGTFHLVDMPGLGYAKVPGAERKKWLAFLSEYARERPQLKTIIHLIDGKLGPLKTDRMLMEMVRDAARGDYVAQAVAQRRIAREAAGAAGAAGDAAGTEEEDVQDDDDDDDDGEEEMRAALGAATDDELDALVEACAASDTGFAGGGAGQWQYAVVLTKIDKGGVKAARRAEALVRRAIEETGCPPPAAVVVTSAKGRVGRGAMWRMLRRVVLGE